MRKWLKWPGRSCRRAHVVRVDDHRWALVPCDRVWYHWGIHIDDLGGRFW